MNKGEHSKRYALVPVSSTSQSVLETVPANVTSSQESLAKKLIRENSQLPQKVQLKKVIESLVDILGTSNTTGFKEALDKFNSALTEYQRISLSIKRSAKKDEDDEEEGDGILEEENVNKKLKMEVPVNVVASPASYTKFEIERQRHALVPLQWYYLMINIYLAHLQMIKRMKMKTKLNY
jgi:hypothetical protein